MPREICLWHLSIFIWFDVICFQASNDALFTEDFVSVCEQCGSLLRAAVIRDSDLKFAVTIWVAIFMSILRNDLLNFVNDVRAVNEIRSVCPLANRGSRYFASFNFAEKWTFVILPTRRSLLYFSRDVIDL